MSTYVAELPSLTIDEDIPKFFENFYATSDNPSSHEEYARAFTDNATLVMGTKTVEGYEKILELRKGMWAGVITTRLHTLKKIFPFGDSSNEVMLYGNVKYGLKNGKDVHVEWAGRALLEKANGKLKMHFYQVYLDSAPMTAAAKEISG